MNSSQIRGCKGLIATIAVAIIFVTGVISKAEDGYRLWLRYDPLPKHTHESYRPLIASVVVPGDSATLEVVRTELVSGCSGLLGSAVPVASEVNRDGTVIAGTPKSSPQIRRLGWERQLADLGPEGFYIRSLKIEHRSVIVIASSGEVGALYGAFHFLRLLQTLQPIDKLDVTQKPRLQLRVLDHWDNLDGTIERGYAGRSLWDWKALPQNVDPRLRDYARANASLGINGSVVNSVNANSLFLSAEYLHKIAAIADTFRPYGVHVYLSPRFSAPIELSGLKTADPFDREVAAWWKKKADEIYKFIPDFGGFLVKANSEGQPGPRTYNRNHVDGANMLAAALAPHNGVVIWRAFVYDAERDYDRAAAAYDELQPFDGKFAANVLLQVKNGPIDFQPREPFHPLFGAMPRTPLTLEVQITKEYLGFATHLVYLGPLFEETLRSDTYAKGNNSTVAKVIDGSLFGHDPRTTGMAGVANIGSDRNWTGSHFDQANWYAFGRLAWDPTLAAADIAADWVKMTFSSDPAFVSPVVEMMMRSREAAVDYMTPLGLH